MLQPSMDLSSVDKSKHKFMVQSMYAPPNFVSDNLDQMVGQKCNSPYHLNMGLAQKAEFFIDVIIMLVCYNFPCGVPYVMD